MATKTHQNETAQAETTVQCNWRTDALCHGMQKYGPTMHKVCPKRGSLASTAVGIHGAFRGHYVSKKVIHAFWRFKRATLLPSTIVLK